MIVINGKEFRTITDPLYANGERVYKAYANGKLVYPNSTGRFAKIWGRIALENKVTEKPSWWGTYNDVWIGPYENNYLVTASFAAVLRCWNKIKGNIGSSGRFHVQYTEANYEWLDRSAYTRSGYRYGTANPLKDAYQSKKDGLPPGYGVHYTSDNYYVEYMDVADFKVRYNCSPFTVEAPLYAGGTRVANSRPVLYTSADATEQISYDYTPIGMSYVSTMQNMPGIFAMNGQTLALGDNTAPWNTTIKVEWIGRTSTSKYDYGGIQISGTGMVPIHYRSWDGSRDSFAGYMQAVIGGRSLPEWQGGSIDGWARVKVYPFVMIPITNIYVGNFKTAPEEMKTVSDSDL